MPVAFPLTPMQKFENWFVRPLHILSHLKDGDAAFIGFGMSLALYERLLRARLKKNIVKGTPDNFRAEASKDLGIDKAGVCALVGDI